MSLRYRFVLIALVCGFASSQAQESSILINNDYFFPGVEAFEQNDLFGLALKSAESLGFTDTSVRDQAYNSYNLDENRSIDLMLEHAARSQDAHQKAGAHLAVANRYFQRKNYDKALRYYKTIDAFKVSFAERHNMQFRMAYCYLVDKNFQEAEGLFANVANSQSPYRSDARYYEGICAFYLGDREKAIESFEDIEDHPSYRQMVPFYLAQIYFRSEEYDKAIKYGKSRIAKSGSDSYLIDRILGLSYLAQGDYRNALPHLENYAENSSTLTENDAFQLASIHYQMGQYEKAKPYFRELSHQESEIGQMSNFLLASTSLETGDTKNAQSAFKQASKLDYFPEIRDESEFLYYKTSAELGDERIAINGFASISSDNDYHNESQDLLSKMLINSSDTEGSIEVIEKLDSKSPEISRSYKKLNYHSALKMIEDKRYAEASKRLENALNEKEPKELDPEIYYWMAYALNKSGDTKSGEEWFAKYLATNHGHYNFESYYQLAYISMDEKSYDQAIERLQKSVSFFQVNDDDKQLFDDAVVRLADLELVKNNYTAALDYYELAIANKAADSDYILYQKSMIYGVNNQIIEKLTSLEKLLKQYPTSTYRDDALFQLAETLVQLGKNNQAYQVYTTIILEYGEKSPYTSIAYMRQGLISFNQGDLMASLDAYKQGVASSSDKDERRRALLAIEDIYLYHLNDPDGYFKYSETLTGQKHTDISKDSIVFNIALSVYKDAEYIKAVELFGDYLRRYPNGFYKGDAHYYLAESYLVQDRFDLALEQYQLALKGSDIKYKKEALKKSAVIAFNHAQDFELSLELYKQIIDSSDGEPEFSSLESAVYAAFKTERFSEVLKYGDLLLGHSQAVEKAKANTHYYMAKAFMAKGNKEEARKQFESVTQMSSNNQAAESSYLISKILFENGDLDGAEQQAYKTAENASAYGFWVAKSILLLAEVYTQRKDYINATAAYESILENFQEEESLINEAKSKLDNLNKTIESESRIVPENKDIEMEFINADSIKTKK